jgi:hypothetical protein
MSQRFGAADGRCFTMYTASGLLNDYLMKTNGISYENNYAYRQFLQSRGPAVFDGINAQQKMINCTSCNNTLLKMPDIY